MNQTDIDYFSKKNHGQEHQINKKRGRNRYKYHSRSYATYGWNGSERGWRRAKDRYSHHSRRGIVRYLISHNLLESETMIEKTSGHSRNKKNKYCGERDKKKNSTIKF